MSAGTSHLDPDQRKGMAVTIAVHVVMLICIFLFGIKYLDPPPLGGMIVAFGMDEDGSGSPAYNEQIPHSEPQPSASSVPYAEVPEEALATQTEDSPLEVKKKPEKEKKTEPKKPDPVKKPAESKPVPEAPKDPTPSKTTSQALANILNPGTDQSKGDGQGTGYKGSPEGRLSSDNYGVAGIGGDGNYRLAGRKALAKPKPEYTGTDQGRVVVRVQVDREGNVISAKYSLQGTEVTDPQLIRNAEQAARQTKWQPNPSAEPVQEGVIIYEFSVRG